MPTYTAPTKPTYTAVEDVQQPGTFRCPARGAGWYGRAELQAWAKRTGCEVEFLTWGAPKAARSRRSSIAKAS
jgi:hypothetical protein